MGFDTVALAMLPAYALGLLVSCALDVLLQPRPVAPWHRPLAALGIHAGVWALAFALALALFRRPVFSVVSVLALQCVFVIVNNAKFRSLREPFVFPDFVFFTDAIKHPRLYLPFLGWLAPLSAALAYATALWLGLTFEAALDPAPGVSPWALWGQILLLAASGLLLAWGCARRLPTPTFDAARDVQRLGLLAALWQYATAERGDTRAIRDAAPFVAPRTPAAAPAGQPDLLVIQSESFFDARRCYRQIRADVLAHYDTLCAESVQHGQLAVDAWGANTIRTEFGFLSGLSPDALGVHRFHPYRKLARHGVATLASYLRGLGYRTLCIHPYHGSFYDRDKVLPQLGFDEFIDIRAFGGAPRVGPYVGDMALGQIVQARLAQKRTQPLYVHVITMENHGPLHCEKISGADAHSMLTLPLPARCEDLVAYLRHLRNMDAMLGDLREFLLQHARPATLCVFGDHVPIMAQVYRQLGAPDGTTDYLLWCSPPYLAAGGEQGASMQPAPAATRRATLRAHQLAQALLTCAGSTGGIESIKPA